jgi:hypothetical protein
MKIDDALTAILDIQESFADFIIGGSAALILAGLLEERDLGDIDIITNVRHYNKLGWLSGFSRDPYPQQEKDGYESYHCAYRTKSVIYNINLLIHNDNTLITYETIIYKGNTIKIQRLDDILCWKKKYNRTKDILDLENIANKLIEDILVTP